MSKSIYVAFEVDTPSEKLVPYHGEKSDDRLKVAIWTTTPWTMPANLAVAVNPDLDYSVVFHEKTGRLLVASDLAQTLAVSRHLAGISICSNICTAYLEDSSINLSDFFATFLPFHLSTP